ncbi:hypothetical protein B0H13DRAFT_2389397 [Mycena leptocephala]|nr:hypothetical protein B0H13DRAFT_2389397 [Mycena leptocephala]
MHPLQCTRSALQRPAYPATRCVCAFAPARPALCRPRARHAFGTKPATAATQSLDLRVKTNVFMPPIYTLYTRMLQSDRSHRHFLPRPWLALDRVQDIQGGRMAVALTRASVERGVAPPGYSKDGWAKRRGGKESGIPTFPSVPGVHHSQCARLFLLLRTKQKTASTTAIGESATIRAKIHPALPRLISANFSSHSRIIEMYADQTRRESPLRHHLPALQRREETQSVGATAMGMGGRVLQPRGQSCALGGSAGRFKCAQIIQHIIIPTSNGASRASAPQQAHSNGTGSMWSDRGGPSCALKGVACASDVHRLPNIGSLRFRHQHLPGFQRCEENVRATQARKGEGE